MDCIGFIANLFNFSIMAYVIYKSSQPLTTPQRNSLKALNYSTKESNNVILERSDSNNLSN